MIYFKVILNIFDISDVGTPNSAAKPFDKIFRRKFMTSYFFQGLYQIEKKTVFQFSYLIKTEPPVF